MCSMRRAYCLTFRATIRPPGRCTRRAWRSVGNWGSVRHRSVAEQPGERGRQPRRLSGRQGTARAEPGDPSGTGDRFGIAISLEQPGGTWPINQGDYPAARALLEESLAIQSGTGGSVQHRAVAEQPGARGPRPGRLSGRQGTARGEPGDPSGTGGSVRHRHVAEQPGARGPQPGRLSGRQGTARGEPGDPSGTGGSVRHSLLRWRDWPRWSLHCATR